MSLLEQDLVEMSEYFNRSRDVAVYRVPPDA